MSNKQSQVYICVGAGGVGKTTVAGVLGLHFAKRGEKTLVITIDPAKRLLDALSMEKKTDHPVEIDISRLTDDISDKGGALFAYMPDLKKEWMDFLTASIGKIELRHEIASNHFYQYMADGLPGAFEIICSHVLFRFIEASEYDKIVLDTPPSSHSLSFFDVPKKLSAVLDQGIFRILMRRRNSFFEKLSKKIAFVSSGILEGTLERLIGSHFLSELIEFALTIDALYKPMLKRSNAMEHLLKSKNTRYVLVLRPTVASINDCLVFKEALFKRGITIDQVVINQTLEELDQSRVKEELSMFQKDSNTQEESVSFLVSFYEKQLHYEKTLVKKILKDFPKTDKRMLYLAPQKDRMSVIKALLNDYETKRRFS